MDAQLIEETPPSEEVADGEDPEDAKTKGEGNDAKKADDEDESPSLLRSGMGGKGLMGFMGVDAVERTNPLTPEQAAELGEREPVGPFTWYIVLGKTFLCLPLRALSPALNAQHRGPPTHAAVPQPARPSGARRRMSPRR
jgi:hypothetical protein